MYFFCILIKNSSSLSGSLSHTMKVWEILKLAVLSWSVVIPNALIGDPSAVFNCTDVACIVVFKLLSMF